MTINLTLFIQVINFLITYWFLNKFMFKPVIEFLNKKKLKEENTKKRLEKKEKELLGLEKKKQEELGIFKIRMKKEYGVKFVQVEGIPSDLHYKVKKEELEKLKTLAKKILVKRIPHVD